MTKAELVAKIAKEQNLDPKKLNRMNMEELKKMDLVVPDDTDLLGSDSQETPTQGSDTDSASADTPKEGTIYIAQGNPSSDSKEVETQEGSIPTGTSNDGPVEEEKKEIVLLGYHPVSGKPVYSDEQ